ncbi:MULTISPECIES: MlaD family protein [unclassified Aeromicrobium]|jgi:phospholipid/cholesterol/gamma-HCH transport system substrate-binding protein|uniref:MlaD family protein n=1 Tax=unclassified Aeromicrobium TaxID=2633570 RepID=UPI0020984775|nr:MULTISPECIES: MlaD family protein [unclassified Aeromicrobium]MCO7239168.1 MCE family protein [Aeromicrobium sp. CnD17-E]MDR6118095.1 phospholipid/cholesterol/gamma-HCH transport system substrate-binding protein [Aeromicrobium sp. SORGH_AS_0981]
MLTGRIKAQIVAFVVLGLLATSYLGLKYVGLDPFSTGYTVTATLPAAGGAFENGQVTYRGVPVGRIDRLEPTDDGVRITMSIEGGAPRIPADASPKVVNRSAIGEQYVDLQGGTAGGAALRDGDRLSAGAESQPPDIDTLLRSGEKFVGSVPKEALTSVIDEGYDATQGVALDFGSLLESSQRFQKAADRNFVVTRGLIENSDRVLRTQEASSQSIRSFSADLSTIAATLESSDGDLRTLIDNTPAAAREIDTLFQEVGRPLGVVLANLVTPAQVFGINANGVQDALVTAPRAFSIGWTITGSRGINLALSQSYFSPLPCTTGYGGTAPRRGTDTSSGQSFNRDAGCRSSAGASNVRGPKNVPSRLGPAPSRDAEGRLVRADVRMADSLADLMGGAR